MNYNATPSIWYFSKQYTEASSNEIHSDELHEQSRLFLSLSLFSLSIVFFLRPFSLFSLSICHLSLSSFLSTLGFFSYSFWIKKRKDWNTKICSSPTQPVVFNVKPSVVVRRTESTSAWLHCLPTGRMPEDSLERHSTRSWNQLQDKEIIQELWNCRSHIKHWT